MKFRDYSKYEVYEDGRIWSYRKNKFLKLGTTKDGYKTVCLFDDNGNKKWYLVHRVVLESVTGEPIPEGLDVNHINEIKTDNRFSNLNLMTRKENINWATGIERCHKAMTNGKLSKSVGAFKNGKLIMTFPSTMEAGRQGFNQGNVAACCRGKLKKYKGFEWKYLN